MSYINQQNMYLTVTVSPLTSPLTSPNQNKAVSSILKDDRFSAMFSNPDFQIDPESEEFRLINPVMSKLDKARKKRQEKDALKRQFTAVEVRPYSIRVRPICFLQKVNRI